MASIVAWMKRNINLQQACKINLMTVLTQPWPVCHYHPQPLPVAGIQVMVVTLGQPLRFPQCQQYSQIILMLQELFRLMIHLTILYLGHEYTAYDPLVLPTKLMNLVEWPFHILMWLVVEDRLTFNHKACGLLFLQISMKIAMQYARPIQQSTQHLRLNHSILHRPFDTTSAFHCHQCSTI